VFLRARTGGIVLAALLLAVAEAHAATTVGFVWTETTGAGTPGGATIEAAPGDRLTGEIRILSTEPSGIAAYGLSLSFDPDLADELNLESVIELLPSGFTHNITPGPEATQESTGSHAGGIRTLEAIALTSGAGVSNAVIAEVKFRVNAAVSSDGTDVFTGAFSPGVDAVGNGDNVDITSSVIFQGASVDTLPMSSVPTGSVWLGPILTLCLGAVGGFAMLRRRARPAAT
jgi:hypothetical protein